MQADEYEAGEHIKRIFVASPDDVDEERHRVRHVINDFNKLYRGVLAFRAYFWEDDSFRAHTDFQSQIDKTPRIANSF